MRAMLPLGVSIIILYSLPTFAAPLQSGTKGQDYDRIVFDNPTDDTVEIVATIKTISTLPGSSSTIAVSDNGRGAFGPRTSESAAWKETISISGKGRHDVLMQCANVRSSPVYCTLEPQTPNLTVVN